MALSTEKLVFDGWTHDGDDLDLSIAFEGWGDGAVIYVGTDFFILYPGYRRVSFLVPERVRSFAKHSMGAYLVAPKRNVTFVARS